MVNYCCVVGCGRNSRASKHLNYYSLPKEKHRQKQWLKLAGREDLLKQDMERLRKSLRFCSRHFHPNCMKNRILSNDAVPSKSLAGSLNDEIDAEPEKHEGVVCDSCSEPICGFRYKCVSCDNYDLCQKCEMLGSHPQHYMLRIPKSFKFQLADDLISKWRKFFKSEHVTPGTNPDDCSSDDEPVTKYIRIRNYDSGIDLSEDVKKDIREEIDRVLKSVEEKAAKQNSNEIAIEAEPLNKKLKLDNAKSEKSAEPKKTAQCTPELVFADVNKCDQLDIKTEVSSSAEIPVSAPCTLSTQRQPLQQIQDQSLPITSSYANYLTNYLPHASIAKQKESIDHGVRLHTSPKEIYSQCTNNQQNHEQTQPMYFMKLSSDLSELMIEFNHNKET